MYVCMWTTADPLENTGRLSPHVFVLWPFCNWPVVSADCLPQLPWRGKASEGMDRNCQSGSEKELGFDDPIMCLFTLPLDPPHYRMLFCFSTLSFRNPKYAITEDFRNVPSVWEACSLGISRPCVTMGQRETVKWICLIWGSVFKCAVELCSLFDIQWLERTMRFGSWRIRAIGTNEIVLPKLKIIS